ncbi:dephospho-CoA kinase [Pseudomonas syringae]|jgi:dephospho-CoA kinase|uniref:Dephospho-CoA kinase n=2 Tax=Pseudomonas syringae TaxID=317 RepID=A0AB74A154_PSESX|nr:MULTISPECIES: dephospho-CoA kinase [Pseudomonas]ALU60657.1 dephospho-CoA kinase [Pseudomonas syringae pv. lapsa]EPF66749.1 Putative dephospho-CoA kinase [Pseudomonas syringae pv. syringae SM]KPX64996.1 putative dephospho-CoA kinase [Pseudomonas syringae pv. lapsa]KTC01355.1 dephospho-CoA kinase [Pseudomonas syringae ICMP 11168]MBI6782876.1 dephospho-CoA kinase [Pseudomonas syringae]
MNHANQLRLALVAPSGSGKSTTAELLREYFETAGLSVEVIKLAQPLYELQGMFYAQAGVQVASGSQNQRLLECIARELRDLDSQSLVTNFARRLARSCAQVVINDDLRDDTVDWPYLQAQGFQVIKVLADSSVRQTRLGQRGDISVVENSALDLQMRRIEADYVLPNSGSLEQLKQRVAVVARWALDDSQRRIAS